MMKSLLIKLWILVIVLSVLNMENNVLGAQSKQTAYNPSLHCQSCLRLIPSGAVNQQGNPIYFLDIYYQGQRIHRFETVTGRAFTQSRNRHRAGTEAPLPDGKYTINSYSVRGTIPEVGGRFIPIYPQFRTGRSALGFHYDPSYNLSNGEDGTAGCIGLTTKTDYQMLQQFIETYHPQLLIVDIQ